jgi:hypothetical protein
MKYDVEGHVLLSEDAAGLDSDSLAEHNEMAEILLGLKTDILYENDDSGAWGDDVLRFVTLQVNHQVANMDEGFTKTGASVGPLSDSFRNRGDGAQFSIHTLVADGIAQLIVDYAAAHLVASVEDEMDGYIVLRSMRNASTSS